MQKIFLEVLDMSIVAGVVILAILVVRLVLKRAPKVYSYMLWAVVLLRLLCPFGMESVLSIVPEKVLDIPQSMALETTEHVTALHAADAAQRALGDVLNGGIGSVWVRLDSEELGNQGISMATHRQVWLLFLGFLWPIGIVGMVLYSAVSYIRLRKSLVGAVLTENSGGKKHGGRTRIYFADYIASPFVMGVIHPRIYLPSTLEESEREYIILHEQYHIRRGDHIIKLLAFAVLCIHWFNPLVWVAFIQSGKDMEMSCDEAVIREKGEQIRAAYSASLLRLALGKHSFAGMPPAFGEGDTKGRIKNLVKWKKPTLWMSAVAVVTAVIVMVICMMNPNPSEQLEMVGEKLFRKEIPEVEQEFVPGTIYTSCACFYMNPLSSTLSDDTGYYYLMEEDSFTAIHKHSGNKTTYDSVVWEWQQFPWTDEQWGEMFLPSLLGEQKVSEYYDEMYYIELSESDYLLWMDGQLWLVDIHRNPRMGEYIWSIYGLAPGEIGDISTEQSDNFSMQGLEGLLYEPVQ